MWSSVSSCDSNEEFLAGTENILKEIHSKVSDLLHATEKAMSEHEREMEAVVSRGTCPDNVNELSIQGDPAGRLTLIMHLVSLVVYLVVKLVVLKMLVLVKELIVGTR